MYESQGLRNLLIELRLCRLRVKGIKNDDLFAQCIFHCCCHAFFVIIRLLLQLVHLSGIFSRLIIIFTADETNLNSFPWISINDH